MQVDEISSDGQTVLKILNSKHYPPKSCPVDFNSLVTKKLCSSFVDPRSLSSFWQSYRFTVYLWNKFSNYSTRNFRIQLFKIDFPFVVFDLNRPFSLFCLSVRNVNIKKLLFRFYYRLFSAGEEKVNSLYTYVRTPVFVFLRGCENGGGWNLWVQWHWCGRVIVQKRRRCQGKSSLLLVCINGKNFDQYLIMYTYEKFFF